MNRIFFFIFPLISLWGGCSDGDKNTETEEAVAPKFLFSTPADKSTDIMLDQEVSVTYNTPIMVDESVELKVNGQKTEVSVNDRKLIFKLALAKNTTYTIDIPEGAVKNKIKEPAAAVSLSFSTTSDILHYEAEDAALSGNAVVETTLEGYTGTGYVNQKEGDILFKVKVAEEGLYKVSLRYSNGNSEKENDLELNNRKLATIKFSATSEWKTISVNKISLNAGDNTIAIRKNWGWINLDYLEVTACDAVTPFDIVSSLVTANPSKEAVSLYTFLKENFGKKIISGAMANYSTGIEEAQWMYDNTGKWPALAGFDLINYTRDWSSINFTELTDNAKNYWTNNGLVTIMWHWRDPSKKTDGFYTKDTSFDISKISDTSSSEYKAIITDIDDIAPYLKELKAANIPVIWRPLHEASGKWFWWGSKGAEPCKALWKVMFDRLVKHHGLNNLIWVWTCDSASDALDWYPGSDYVDILGMDIYPGENQHGSQYIAFDKVKELFNGKKIITLSECGSVPSIDTMFEYGDTWSWFMPWNGDYTRSDKHNGATFLKSVMNHNKVITRDVMPSLK